MDADPAIGRIGAPDAFQTIIVERKRAFLWHGAGELLRHRLVRIANNARRSEAAPADDVEMGVRGMVQQVVQPPLAMFDVQKFVAIQAGQPFGLSRQRVIIGAHQGGLLHAALLDPIIDDMGAMAKFGEAVPDGVGAVLTIIGVDEKLIEPDGQVIGGPFQDEGTFVFHGGYDQAHGGGDNMRGEEGKVAGRYIQNGLSALVTPPITPLTASTRSVHFYTVDEVAGQF